MDPFTLKSRWRLFAWLGAILIIALLNSCSAGQVAIEKEEGREAQMIAAAEASSKIKTFPARYNPPACPCPGFEVNMSGLWVRVELVGPSREGDLVRKLEKAAQETAQLDPPRIFYLTGEPDPNSVFACATGFPVMVFQLKQFSLSKPALTPLKTP
tara:strand:- start:286 stop:753 length:468 start_codon:yes stop_codon:yes gene_type:complete